MAQGIAHWFELQAGQHPERLAISAGADRITYCGINSLANRLAHGLFKQGLPRGEPVALLLDQGVAYISALLAVLKSGGFFVPLDPANPPARNGQMVADSGARFMLVQSHTRTIADRIVLGGSCRLLDVEDLIRDMPDENPGLSVPDDSLAYVLYTSGSTGRPKGVVQDQCSVLHNMRRHREAFGILPADRQTLLYTCSVYGGTRDIFNALLNGASLHVFPVRQQGVAGLADWLRRERITLYCSVATVFRQFVDTLDADAAFPDLRWIKLGGEASNRRDLALYRAHFPRSCRLHCGLGSTETGVVRHFIVDHDTDIEGSAVPLGYPVDGVTLQLVDDEGNEVAAGEVGEIVIRSRFMARGYWNRPDLNSTAIVADPCNPELRIYRSGDLGMLRPDGCLVHRGRKDHLVKIRGNRVELADVELALRDLDALAHAVVKVHTDAQGQVRLVAYVVARAAPPTVSALRAALAARLPEFMIPAIFIVLDALPQTPNGKVDRQALPEPDFHRPQLQHAYVEPRTQIEVQIAQIWRELLNVQQIGVRDSFFDLGGNSLLAAALMARIKDRYSRALPLAVLLKASTVQELAALVESGVESPWSPLVAMKPQGSRVPLFCIHPGGGNVLGYKEFIDLMDPEQPVYGLQAYGVVEGQQPHHEIPEMAREYLRVIREVRPKGPYRLGGESFGGLVAYEMACQLEQSGEQVDFLFVGDVWPRNLPGFDPVAFRLSRLSYPFVLKAAQWQELFARKVLRRKSAKVYVRRYTYADELHRRNSLSHRQASAGFQPKRYPGRLTLFRASEFGHEAGCWQHYLKDPCMGWSRVVSGGIDLHWMPDEHYEMMHGRNAAGFARRLQHCLDLAG